MASTFGYTCGFIAGGLTLASYMMHSMMPLRIVALVANVFWIAYGAIELAWPSLVAYALTIPINAKKAWTVHKLVQAIEHAKSDAPVADWLLPNMLRRVVPAGQTLWRKGDEAKEMLYVHDGTLRLVEIDETLGKGALVGEIGLFAPDNRRTLTLQTETACTLYSLSADGMAQLYFQNPKLGYHVMRLVVARLMRDSEKAKARADAVLTAATAPQVAVFNPEQRTT